MHMGSGKAKLDPIFYVLDHSDVPAKNLLPTHMLRSPELIDAGVELVKRGGYIDCTAGSDEVAVKEDARKLFDLLHREGVNPDHVSLSSDAYGSQPRFNDAGECVGLTYASPKYLHKTIRALVRMGMPLEQALKLLTTTPDASPQAPTQISSYWMKSSRSTASSREDSSRCGRRNCA